MMAGMLADRDIEDRNQQFKNDRNRELRDQLLEVNELSNDDAIKNLGSDVAVVVS